ncbi:MAG: septal ring lytic transglycosylase RlpA family protein [Candidatus Omnitrophica bacterium]|nr:septal ring lytic transglycosylase RlpA family protein [Candidatus Omnitrophota bacterium]
MNRRNIPFLTKYVLLLKHFLTQPKPLKLFILLVVASLICLFCTTHRSRVGIASWYGKVSRKKTANGERYDRDAYTAAHRTLAFGTLVKVKNLTNGKFIVVRVNDRGPYVRGRIIDLSYAAAKKIDIIKKGITKVHLEIFKL